MAGVFILCLAVMVLMIAGMWTTFTKAGAPGWAAIVPIYNLWVRLKIARQEGWMIVLYLIPFVKLFVAIFVSIELGKAFGKTAGFGWGLALLPFIFYPMLGFGEAHYQHPPVQ